MRYIKEVTITQAFLKERKVEDVAVVDVRERTPFADYYILATCPNEKAIAAYANEAQEVWKKAGFEVRKIEGIPASGWIIVDGGQVVLHLFTSSKRTEIGLDELLSTAKR